MGDDDRWLEASTLLELGELTAQWFEGAVSTSPWQAGPPDEETAELVPVVARLNRAGFVTELSQPARPRPEAHRATVSGFVEPDLASWLELTVGATDLVIVSFDGADEDYPLVDVPSTIPITMEGGEPGSWAGGARDRGSLADFCLAGDTEEGEFASLSPEMVAELGESVQVTLIDPVWGRANLLWEFLAAALDAYSEVVAAGVEGAGSGPD